MKLNEYSLDKAEFHPFVVEITIETEEDFDILYSLFAKPYFGGQLTREEVKQGENIRIFLRETHEEYNGER